MQTHFSLAALADPDMAESERILRNCVHCGFCLATCPTYVLLGDELDSPRGRIYLIKEMLEGRAVPVAETVVHIDRCLSCLSCMTTCPAGVNYEHLIEQGRRHIETHYRRPWRDRLMRWGLAAILPRPGWFRLGLRLAQPLRGLARLLPGRLAAMLRLTPRRIPRAGQQSRLRIIPAQGSRRRRVGLLAGCAQTVLAPAIHEAAIRLLTRHGCEVVVPPDVGCCGALPQHMGRTAEAQAFAKQSVAGWLAEINGEGLDAIVVTASGCGSTLKQYDRLLAQDPECAAAAAQIAALACDISEILASLGLRAPTIATGQRVAYHAACSLQHGQKIRTEPKALLAAAGFEVVEPADSHLCCGSAGTYNLLQPEIAGALLARKIETIDRLAPVLIASGNIGCLTQIASRARVPVVHSVELLDWATGGPKPVAFTNI